ncbi:Lrp/AsnC family transcriptional regulator [Halomarina pelagica]|uniref:Lrp/AsnC family transcriptional regulator n=1 Tax=Halomarina pelagica TaxID=2961599 RepID=UPI0020C24EE1|nr:Lrp/AsnC family transcriptional regulator [Halomarina sp. BND7]
MDEKDIRILSAIAKQKTGSPDAIAEVSGIPKSTVHYRIQRLEEKGVITNDLLDVDLDKIGLSITLISEVWAEFKEGYHESVGEKLSEIEGVNQVYFTLGDTDFVVVSHLSSRQQVERLVERFEATDEIQRTSSTFVISTVKSESNAVADYELETLLDLLL